MMVELMKAESDLVLQRMSERRPEDLPPELLQ